MMEIKKIITTSLGYGKLYPNEIIATSQEEYRLNNIFKN